MTDLTRTLNVYYTAEQYIDPAVTSIAQPAMVDEKLIYPLIKDASQFQVALTKCKVPLDTIPLTQSNIPLKGWEIQLRKNGITGNAYVAQVNSNVATNFIWSAQGGIVSKYTYSSTGILTLVGTIDVSASISNITMICVDDFQNLYVIGKNALYGFNNLFFVFSNTLTPTTYFSATGVNFTCVAIDRNQTIYLADQNLGVYVYTNIPNETSVTLNLSQTITLDFNNALLTNIATVCSDYTTIIGYNVNKIQLYNSEYAPISSPITLTEITNLGNQSSILHDQGTFILSDAGVVLDSVYGQVLAEYVVNNVTTAVSAFVGSWNDCPKPQQSEVFCLGVGSDGQTYRVANNPTANPVLIADDQTATQIASDSENGWYGYYSPTNTLNYFNQTETNIGTHKTLCTDFKPTTGIFDCIDISKQTGKSFQVSHTDNKLYTSNLPVAPLQIYTGINGGDIAYSLERYDTFPINGTTTNVSNTSFTGYLQYRMLGMYEFIDTANSNIPSYLVVFVELSQDVSGFAPNFALYVFPKNNLTTPTRSVGYNGNSNIGGANCQPVAMCGIAGMVCIYNGFGGFYCFDQITLLAKTSFDFVLPVAVTPTTFDNVVCMTSFFDYLGNQYMLVTNGDTICLCVPDVTYFEMSNQVLIGLPENYGTTLTNVYAMSVIYAFDHLTVAYIAAGSAYALDGAALCTVNYYYSTDALVIINPFSSAVYNSRNYYKMGWKFNNTVLATLVDSNNFMSYNNLGYLTIPALLGGTADIWYYNQTNAVLEFQSTITIPSFQLAQNLIPQIFITANTATGLYTYNTNVPTSLDGSLGYISFSVNNESTIYATSIAGALYQGSVNTSPIVFTLKPTAENINYNSIAGCNAQSFNSSVFLFTLSNQAVVTSQGLGNYQITGLTRNMITGQYFSTTAGGSTPLIAYPATTLLPEAWSSAQQLGSIFVKNGENIDSGNASIYTYQTLIDAINVAFQTAFIRANVNGAGLITAPSITMNFQTGLCTLHYDGEYVNSVNGILTNSDGILFNSGLNNLIRFNSKPDTITPSLFLLYLTTESGVSPYSVVQNTKTITVFNKLDKILIQSNTIYVAQSFFGNNQTNNVITDIDVDTSSIIENIGQWFLYQPNFLRPFILSSNNAIDRIQIMVGYSYIDGTTYQLYINPSQGWNAKLDFVRKFSF